MDLGWLWVNSASLGLSLVPSPPGDSCVVFRGLNKAAGSGWRAAAALAAPVAWASLGLKAKSFQATADWELWLSRSRWLAARRVKKRAGRKFLLFLGPYALLLERIPQKCLTQGCSQFSIQAAPEHGIQPLKTVTEGALLSSAGPSFPELPSSPGGASARGQCKVYG